MQVTRRAADLGEACVGLGIGLCAVAISKIAAASYAAAAPRIFLIVPEGIPIERGHRPPTPS